MKKYCVGMDVHQATIATAVLDASGKLVPQSIIETSTQAIKEALLQESLTSIIQPSSLTYSPLRFDV